MGAQLCSACSLEVPGRGAGTATPRRRDANNVAVVGPSSMTYIDLERSYAYTNVLKHPKRSFQITLLSNQPPSTLIQTLSNTSEYSEHVAQRAARHPTKLGPRGGQLARRLGAEPRGVVQ